MAKPFDYSKWDKIELSDDESDVHPNIDKDSWFRLKHRTRLEREQKEDEEIVKIQQQNSEDQARINIINARLKGLKGGNDDEDAEFEDVDALKDEAKELETNIKSRNKRIDEIQEKRKWNIDNICKVKDEKTIVNNAEIKSLKAEDFQPTGLTESALAKKKQADSQSSNTAAPTTPTTTASSSNSTSPSTTTTTTKPVTSSSTSTTISTTSTTTTTSSHTPKSREKFSVMSYNDYVLQHEKLLEQYSIIKDLEETKKLLFQSCDILLHDHAQSYLLLSCLEDEMNNKRERMKLVCRQSQILSHISELGKQMNRDPRDVILPFFYRLEEKQYLDGFLKAVEEFRDRIIQRAIVKRKEMDEEAKKEREKERSEVPLGPGGLNPMEVFESLPIELQEAFESQSVEALQQVIASMKPNEAKYHMKRCVDSGLWVPKEKSIFDDKEGEEDQHENQGEGESEEKDEKELTSNDVNKEDVDEKDMNNVA